MSMIDIKVLNERLETMTPPDAVEAFTYLSGWEKMFCCRALLEELYAAQAAGVVIPPHLQAWLDEEK